MLDTPGTKERYSNPGMAMLGYCVTASLRETDDADLRSLLKHRIMRPLGVPDAEWSVGYGTVTTVDGLPPGGDVGRRFLQPERRRQGRSARSCTRVTGRDDGDRPTVVDTATRHSGMPGHSGLGWWVNRAAGGTRLWKSAPEDAFGRCRRRSAIPPGRPQP